MRSIFLICFISVIVVSCYRKAPIHDSCFPLAATDYPCELALETNNPSFEFREDGRWWGLFQDASLEKIIEIALNCNPTVKIATDRIEEAYQQVVFQRSFFFPEIGIEADVLRQKYSNETQFGKIPFPWATQVTLGVNVSYQLDIWKKNRYLFEAELSLLQQQILDRVAAQLFIAEAVSSRYFSLQQGLERVAIQKSLLQNRCKYYALLEKKRAQGLISSIPLLDQEVEMRAIESTIAQLEGEILQDKHALRALTAQNPEVDLECLDFNASLACKFPLPCSLPFDLLARRPEIVGQKWRIEAENKRVLAKETLFYPNVDLMGFLGVISIDMAQLFSMSAMQAFGQAATSLPIFDAFKRESEVNKQVAELNIAIDTYEGMILEAIREVLDGVTLLHTVDRKISSYECALGELEESLHLKRVLYERGLEDALEVLAVEERVLLIKDILAKLFQDRLTAGVFLIKAIGGGYHE